MSRGRGRRGALAGLVVAAVGLSGCALSVPGLGGGSSFDEALAAIGPGTDGEGR